MRQECTTARRCARPKNQYPPDPAVKGRLFFHPLGIPRKPIAHVIAQSVRVLPQHPISDLIVRWHLFRSTASNEVEVSHYVRYLNIACIMNVVQL